MKKITPIIVKENTEEMVKAGRFNPCLEIIFKDKTGAHKNKISAGYSDDLFVYQEDLETFVLSKNLRLDYIGLQIFKGSEKIGEMFLQGQEQIQDVLGKIGIELASFNIIRRMKKYIYY